MTIDKKVDGGNLTVALSGRLDTTTAPQLETEFNNELPGKTNVTLDMADLAYISSAGLRVLLAAQKTMNRQGGSMVLTHVNEVVMEVFEVTGFTDILSIM